jgi:5-methyltetrahydrofolate--homocysteine methyltransferase
VDIIGLSGLITPSLDEMVHVASEMQRRNFKIPLLIGGATASRVHTAVKIEPKYEEGVVYVLDASRSVTTVGQLVHQEKKKTFLKETKVEYEKLRRDFARKQGIKQYINYPEACKNAMAIDWTNFQPYQPRFTGIKVFRDFDLREITKFMDWTPFFISWEMKGKFPQILEDEHLGKEASKLYEDALNMLERVIREGWLKAHGVIGFWPANRTGADSLTLFDETGKPLKSLEMLRQQIKKAAGQPAFSLADFIAPESAGVRDYMGAFAVSISGIEPHLERFIKEHDDYNKILLQGISDRLVESFAECLHHKVRTEYWGYAPDEKLGLEALIKETYQGIRPAPGYPACPDHTEKWKLFELMDVTENTGIVLTDHLAMHPASSVCGWYFSHPQSIYFGVGKVREDQFQDYCSRKDIPEAQLRKWLQQNME